VHATIRRYDSPQLADLLESRSDEVESLMSGVPGLQGYFLVRTDDGCASVTICDEAAGTEESTRIAGNWVRENASGLTMAAPDISSGDVVIQIGASARA
jgi:hypothetical protein